MDALIEDCSAWILFLTLDWDQMVIEVSGGMRRNIQVGLPDIPRAEVDGCGVLTV